MVSGRVKGGTDVGVHGGVGVLGQGGAGAGHLVWMSGCLVWMSGGARTGHLISALHQSPS